MTDAELIARLRSGDRMNGKTVDCKHDRCNCGTMDEAADRIEALVGETGELWEAEQRGYANAMEAERKLHEDRIEELVKERDKWIEHTKNAVWADSEELKLANARVERLVAAGKAYREATRHLKPCPETAAGFDAALKGDGHVGT